MRGGHRQGGGVGGWSSGVVCENNFVGSEFSEGMRTHTLFEYPLGKPLEAKLLKEFDVIKSYLLLDFDPSVNAFRPPLAFMHRYSG